MFSVLQRGMLKKRAGRLTSLVTEIIGGLRFAALRHEAI
jgi:hypothetical protein